MKRQFVLVVIGILFLSGCASYFKRKECEKINWHGYGYDLAMKGTRPANDNLVNECRKVEAEMSESQLDNGFKEGMSNYCKPETVYMTGKKGEKLNLDLCDPGQSRILTAKHAEGVKAYCQPESGLNEGTSGRAYTNICPPDLEKKFLPEYKKGRKKYLAAVIIETENLIKNQDAKINSLLWEGNRLSGRLAGIPSARTVVDRKWDDPSKSYREESRIEDPYQYERDRIKSEIDSNQNSLANEQSKKSQYEQALAKFRSELITLD